MHRVLCFSVCALLSLVLVNSQFKEEFRKVDKKRSTDSEDFMLPHCPPLPEIEDDKPKEAIDPYCLEEERKRLKKENLSLKNENTELKKQVGDQQEKTAKLVQEILQLKQMVGDQQGKTAKLEQEILQIKQMIRELGGDQDGTKDILHASKIGSLAGVKYWYRQDPSSIHKKDGDNYTPLHWASYKGYLAMVQFLLSNGAEVDAVESHANTTPLILASVEGSVPIVEALLDKGANINHLDGIQSTALHRAVLFNHLPVVKLLITRGADRSLKDKLYDTPLDIARKKGFIQIEDYLSSH